MTRVRFDGTLQLPKSAPRVVDCEREIDINLTLRGPSAVALQVAAERRNVRPIDLMADVIERLMNGEALERYLEVEIEAAFDGEEIPSSFYVADLVQGGGAS